MSTLLAFLLGALAVPCIFAAVMAAIEMRGEQHRPGYGTELHAWWNERPWPVDVVAVLALIVGGLLTASDSPPIYRRQNGSEPNVPRCAAQNQRVLLMVHSRDASGPNPSFLHER